MIKFDLIYDIGQGDIPVTSTLRAICEWEEKYSRSSLEFTDPQKMRLGDLRFIAWASAIHRQIPGITALYGDFAKKCIDLRFAEPAQVPADTTTEAEPSDAP
jgi:hypothetical protein